MLLLVLILAAASAAPELEKVTTPIEHGEGPHWSVEEQALYWVDITQRDVWRLHPESGNLTKCHIEEGDVSVIVPIKDEKNTFAVGVGDMLKILKWNGQNDSQIELGNIVSFAPLPKGARLNDGKVDADNRLWIGTIGPEENNMVEEGKGDLYKVVFDEDKIEAQFQVRNVSVSNGIAWSGDGNIMYYVDSPTKKIDAFDFNPQNGTLSNRRDVFDLEAHNISGVPDGMTIDADDNLWIALFGGEAIIVVQAHLGRLIKTYPIPGTPQVTSVAWGGPNLDILYITTSSRGNVPGGELYQLKNSGARGHPANHMTLPNIFLKNNNE